MSTDTQAIFFFLAFLGCVLASFWGYWDADNRGKLLGFHPGWLGLASFCFVFFWIAVKAA